MAIKPTFANEASFANGRGKNRAWQKRKETQILLSGPAVESVAGPILSAGNHLLVVMTDQNSPKTPIRCIPWFLGRAMDVAAGCVLLSIVIFAIGSAVFVFGFVVFKGEKSSDVAAWVQAIASPLAIAGAFLTARYQANRADDAAALQRQMAAEANLAEKSALDRRSRLDGLEREAAVLTYVHGALITAALPVEAVLNELDTTPEISLICERHVEHFQDTARRLDRVDVSAVRHSRCQLTIAAAVQMFAVVSTGIRLNLGDDAAVLRRRINGLIPTVTMAIIRTEDRVAEISAELAKNGREAVRPQQLLRDSGWGLAWWDLMVLDILNRGEGGSRSEN